MAQRTALLAGATGLVGQALLSELLASPVYDRVVAVGRRAPPVACMAQSNFNHGSTP